jgi:hypothetical protein
MTDYLRADAELSIKEGMLEEFKVLANAVIEKVKANEPNTLSYELYLSKDGSQCHVAETYRDSDAVMAHLGNIGEILGSVLEVAPLTRFKLYGNPSDEVRQALEPLGTQFFDEFSGFAR